MNCCYKKHETVIVKMFTVFIIGDVTVKKTQYESNEMITMKKGFWFWVIFETLYVRGHVMLGYRTITDWKMQRDPPSLHAVEEYARQTLTKQTKSIQASCHIYWPTSQWQSYSTAPKKVTGTLVITVKRHFFQLSFENFCFPNLSHKQVPYLSVLCQLAVTQLSITLKRSRM